MSNEDFHDESIAPSPIGDKATSRSYSKSISGHTVTRACLAAAVQRATNMPRHDAARFVEEILSEIIECLVKGEEVKLSSFGSFETRRKRQRLGRNPKTGADATITGRRVVVFRASNILRAKINRETDE